jgi:hypothetical protein
MKKHIYFILLIFSMLCVHSQLLPSIGLNTQPASSATICEPPYYTGSFYASGYQVGDTVADFKLYNLLGDSLILSDQLQNGKPVLLIAGSLTCPVFRSKVTYINQVMATYGSSVSVFVIYTIEAHPTDTSIYSGNVNVTSQNITDGVLFPSPQTYGDRKQMVDTMPNWVNLNAPVFIDGPCNEWWNNFGPAPNNSYLIDTNGIVVSKHGWFHKLPADNIFCDIDNYLGITSGSCVTTTAPGHFSVNVTNNISYSSPGQVLYDFAQIVNTQSVPVTVSAQMIQTNIPTNWQVSFCADVCYSTLDTYISFVVSPFDTLLFSLDFYTDMIPDSGRVKVGFQNVNNTSNAFAYWLRASTLPIPTGLNANVILKNSFDVYPNPARDKISFETDEKDYSVKVHDIRGVEKQVNTNGNSIDTEWLQNGIYFLTFRSAKGSVTKKIIISR